METMHPCRKGRGPSFYDFPLLTHYLAHCNVPLSNVLWIAAQRTPPYGKQPNANGLYRPLGKIFMSYKQTINTATPRGWVEGSVDRNERKGLFT